MTLQFKPQMYLDSKGKPAGYDVVLLKALAKQWGVKLDIKNLDFNGLIPGLVSKKFDMVSVGLSATPSGGSRSASAGRTSRTRRSSVREERHDGRHRCRVERLGQDDHIAAGVDGRAARPEDVPERDVALVP